MSSPFVSFPQHAAPLWDNLIKVLSPKAKSTMDERLDFNLSWGSFVHNVENSDVLIDLARSFYLCYLITEWWGLNTQTLL